MRTIIDDLYEDIWLQIFEYFNAMELFTSFAHVTETADALLFNRNRHLFLRQLVVDVHIKSLPEKLLLSQVLSLELYQENCLNIIDQCLELRSLKLTGQPEWIIRLFRNVSHVTKKLENLILVIPDVSLLRDILASIAQIFSLRRLEIHANQFEGKIRTGRRFPMQVNIERLVFDSCSSVDMHELSDMLSSVPKIRSLDINLFYCKKSCFTSCIFANLCYIHLTLLEVSFQCIIQLVTTTPALIKLKLNGLVDDEGFVTNHKWINLFESCPSLATVIVNVSLESCTYSLSSEIIQTSLRIINLDLRSFDDDYDHCSSEINYQRWWKLCGIIIRHRIPI